MATLSAMVEAPFNSDSLADTELEANRSGEETPNNALLSPTSAVRCSRRVQRKKEERKECEGEDVMLGSPVSQPLVAKSCDEYVTRSDDPKKSRRVWEQWSTRDKTIFFEALGESGKNFEAIQTAFQARQKRMGLNLIKNKEQIRTFYYRSWHKISKYLRFPDNIKKNTRELYGLINYGEMRKRLGEECLGENRGAKLQELVFSGYTTVRLKGKTCRIKTPVCRALERLKKSSLGQKTDTSSLKLPQTLNLHLKPLNAPDFAFVHRQCFQNPILSISLDLHVRLQSVIQMLQSKWSPSCSFLNANDSMSCKSSQNQTSLTLHVPPEVQIRRPIIQSVEPLTSAKLSVSQMDKASSNEECEECNVDHDTVTPSETVERSNVEVAKEESSDMKVNAEVISSSVGECEASKGSCEELKRCWDVSTAGCLTMGELLLMCTSSSSEAKKELTLFYSVTDKTEELADSNNFFSSLSRIAQRESQRLDSAASIQEQTPAILSPEVTGDPNKVIKENADKESRATCPSQSSLTTFVFPTPSAINPSAGGSRPMPVMPKDGDVSSQSSAQVEAFCRQMRELRKGRKGGRPPNRRSIITRRLLPVNPQPLLPALKVPIAAETSNSTTNPTSTKSTPSDEKPQQGIVIDFSTPPTNVSASDSVSDESSTTLGREKSTVASKSDLFLDSVLEPSNSSSSALLQLRKDAAPSSTPPTSPFRVSSEEWLPDLSLSSLLGLSTEQSPSKTTGSRSVLNTPHHPLLSEDSVQSTGSEVDRQLLSMLNTENSVDFTMKFAKLAAHVSGNDN